MKQFMGRQQLEQCFTGMPKYKYDCTAIISGWYYPRAFLFAVLMIRTPMVSNLYHIFNRTPSQQITNRYIGDAYIVVCSIETPPGSQDTSNPTANTALRMSLYTLLESV